MFSPTRDQSRLFLSEAWRKHCARELMTPLEDIAARVIELHPEYHTMLSNPESIERDFAVEDGTINPFLHLSLHLAIAEQLSIDQPPGIRLAYDKLIAKLGDEHAALHIILECLGETIWQAQRTRSALDSQAYLDAIKNRI